MTRSEFQKEIRKYLDDKIPKNAVTQRKGPGGKMLDYLEGHYVIRRLNEIFGTRWSYTTMILGCEGEGRNVQVMAMVKLTVVDDEGNETTRQDVGFGNGDTELAHKESVTDGLKRAARTLGESLGNALYDKSKEGIEKGAPKQTKAEARGELYPRLEKAIREVESLDDLYKLLGHDKFKEAFESLPQDWQPHLDQEIANKEKALERASSNS